MTDGSGPTVGYRVGSRYELTSPIATGGMAQVWRAHDTVLDRPVAVKLLHPHLSTDHGFLTRFRREAVAAARLSHPSIVGIYDTVSTPTPTAGSPSIEAIVMELVEGRTLREVLDATPRLSAADAAGIGLQVADALDEAHRSGVIHRDIKPSNILLCSDRRVMVTDFGIAKAGEDTDLTVTGALLGTAKYLAPEQVTGDEIDPRVDLYALGVVLYEALAGRAPFAADTDAATALARLHNDPPDIAQLRPDADPRLTELVTRLLARDPGGRPGRALDVRAALSAISHTDPTAPITGSIPAVGPSAPASATDRNQFDATAVDAPTTHVGSSAPAAMTPGPATLAEGDDEPGFVQSERSWLIPAVVTLALAGALVLAAALLNRSPLGDSSVGSSAESAGGGGLLTESPTETTPLSNVEVFVEAGIVGARSFDPGGDGTENEDLVAAAFDGDLTTSWRTETYRGADFGRLKAGVGLLLDLGGRAEVEEVEVRSPTIGFELEIYVGDDFSGQPATWGEPAAAIGYTGDDEYEVELNDAVGTTVLLWVTDHGISPDRDDNPLPDFRFELTEVSVS